VSCKVIERSQESKQNARAYRRKCWISKLIIVTGLAKLAFIDSQKKKLVRNYKKKSKCKSELQYQQGIPPTLPWLDYTTPTDSGRIVHDSGSRRATIALTL
jgi:hypothetical protein